MKTKCKRQRTVGMGHGTSMAHPFSPSAAINVREEEYARTKNSSVRTYWSNQITNLTLLKKFQKQLKNLEDIKDRFKATNKVPYYFFLEIRAAIGKKRPSERARELEALENEQLERAIEASTVNCLLDHST